MGAPTPRGLSLGLALADAEALVQRLRHLMEDEHAYAEFLRGWHSPREEQEGGASATRAHLSGASGGGRTIRPLSRGGVGGGPSLHCAWWQAVAEWRRGPEARALPRSPCVAF